MARISARLLVGLVAGVGLMVLTAVAFIAIVGRPPEGQETTLKTASEPAKTEPTQQSAAQEPACLSYLTADEFRYIVKPAEEIKVEFVSYGSGKAFMCHLSFLTPDGKSSLFLRVWRFASKQEASEYFDKSLSSLLSYNLNPKERLNVKQGAVGERLFIFDRQTPGVWNILGFQKGEYAVITPSCGTTPGATLHKYVPSDEQLLEVARMVDQKLKT